MHQWAQHKSLYKQHFSRKGLSGTSEDCGYRNLYPFPWPSQMALDMLSVHLVIDVAREPCLGICRILTWFPGEGVCGPPKLSTVKHGDSNKKSHNPSLPFSFNPKQQSSKWSQIVLKASGKWLNHGLLMNLFFYVLKCLKCLITS